MKKLMLVSLVALLCAGAALAAPAVAPVVPSTDCAPAAADLPMLERPAWQSDAGSVVYTSSGCTAYATCDNGAVISCSATGPGVDCTARDSDCDNGISGYIDCNGNETLCTPCPPDCDSPPLNKCISGLACQQGCGHCGPGTCMSNGTCNCLA